MLSGLLPDEKWIADDYLDSKEGLENLSHNDRLEGDLVISNLSKISSHSIDITPIGCARFDVFFDDSVQIC